MKTTAASLLFFLLTLALSGCDGWKDDYISKYCPGSCTVITGKLTTANGTKPLAHVTLALNWEVNSYPSGYVTKKAIAKTDENGNYELRFLIRDNELKDGRFVMEPLMDEKQFIYCRDEKIDFSYYDLKRDTTLVENYLIPEVAYVEFQLRSPGSLPAGDKLTTHFSYTYGKDGQLLCTGKIDWSNISKNGIIVRVAADQPVTLKNSRLRNGVSSEEETVLQMKPGEKKIVSIEL